MTRLFLEPYHHHMFFSVTPTQHTLYNMSRDIGETNELASAETEKLNELKSLRDNWSATMAQPLWGQPTAANPVDNSAKQ